jgi:hypothetical protein
LKKEEQAFCGEPGDQQKRASCQGQHHERAETVIRKSERKVSKRGRVNEGRPTKRTPEVVAKIAAAIASGLTDREAGLLAGIRHDTMTEWRKDPEFSEAIEKTTAQRLLQRLGRIEAGEQGWQGTAWALERLYPARFARPEVMNQIAVVNQRGKASAERVIVLPDADFEALIDRPGYNLRENGDLERREGSLVYVIIRQQSNRALPLGESSYE